MQILQEQISALPPTPVNRATAPPFQQLSKLFHARSLAPSISNTGLSFFAGDAACSQLRTSGIVYQKNQLLLLNSFRHEFNCES